MLIHRYMTSLESPNSAQKRGENKKRKKKNKKKGRKNREKRQRKISSYLRDKPDDSAIAFKELGTIMVS